MKEQFPKQPNSNEQNLSIEAKELLESEIGVDLKIVERLKPFFERSVLVTHQPSGKERLYIQFPVGEFAKTKKVELLLDLIDIIPIVSEEQGEIIIDSPWDIEKLSLLGILPAQVEHDEENSVGDSYNTSPFAFGAFPIKKLESSYESRKNKKVTFESGSGEVEEAIPVDQYIERNQFYTEQYTEQLAREVGKYTSIDTSKGINFLRDASRYEWKVTPKGRSLFEKSSGRQISESERQETIKRAQEYNSQEVNSALNSALEMNVALVYFVLNNLLSLGFRIRSIEDTLQEGLLGLQNAIQKYQPNLGAKFSTYAVIYIESRMRRFIEEDDLVRNPSYIQNLRAQIRRVGLGMEQVDGKTPSVRDVAKILDLDPNTVEKKLNGTFWHQELLPIEEHLNQITDEFESLRPDQYAEKEELKTQIREVLWGLTPRQAHVIKARFGIYDDEERDNDSSLQDVGLDINLTAEGVRLNEMKALRKLRLPSRTKILIDAWLGTNQRLYDVTIPSDQPMDPLHPNDKNNTTSAQHDRGEIEE